MFDHRDLRLITVLVTHGSMVRASRVLDVTPSAVTRALAALEERLGCSLFDRSRRGLAPTNVCCTMVAEAQEILCRVDALNSLVTELRGRQTDELVVACGPYALETVMASAAARFSLEMPRTRLRIATGHVPGLVRDVHERRVDLALVELAEIAGLEDLSVTPLHRHPVLLAVRAGHPLTKAGTAPLLSEILRYPLIAPGILPARVAVPFAEARRAAAGAVLHEAFPAVELDSISVGLGVARCSEAVVPGTGPAMASSVASGALTILPFHAPWLVTNFGIVSLKRRVVSPAMTRISSCLQAADAEALAILAALCPQALAVERDPRDGIGLEHAPLYGLSSGKAGSCRPGFSRRDGARRKWRAARDSAAPRQAPAGGDAP